jgi:MFS superfamily sulfate permease-like transporter
MAPFSGTLFSASFWVGRCFQYPIPHVSFGSSYGAKIASANQTPDLNRELMASGLGNSLSGMLGGLPMTGAMIRSVAVVNAGAYSRWAIVLHGVWIIVLLSLFSSIILHVPLTALAAVLILAGSRLLKLKELMATAKQSQMDALLWTTTTVAILATNLMIGVAIALGFVIVSKGIEFALRRLTTRGDDQSEEYNVQTGLSPLVANGVLSKSAPAQRLRDRQPKEAAKESIHSQEIQAR